MLRLARAALALLSTSSALAAAPGPGLLEGASEFYAQGDYPHALELVQRARTQCRTSRELATVALYQGAVEAQAGQKDAARDTFQLALYLWPGAKLPLRVSSSVQAEFDALSSGVRRERGSGSPADALAAAESAFARADFETAITATFRALGGELTPPAQKRAWELQAFAHAAYGRTSSAVDAFRRVLAVDAGYALGPDESPRLRALLSQARSEGPWLERPVEAPAGALIAPAASVASPLRERAWIPAAAGVALGLGGMGCFAASNARFQDLSGSRSLPEQSARTDVAEGKLFQGLGVAAVVGAAVGLALGGAFYVWGDGTGAGAGVATRWP